MVLEGTWSQIRICSGIDQRGAYCVGRLPNKDPSSLNADAHSDRNTKSVFGNGTLGISILNPTISTTQLSPYLKPISTT